MAKKLIVYHTNWACYGRNYQVSNLPINYITDINYAFLDLKQNDQGYYVPAFSDPWADIEKVYGSSKPVNGNLGEFIELKKHHQFSFGLSIGGWSYSKHFSEALMTPESRICFIQSIIEIIGKYPTLIDRIDLDWEHISPNNLSYGDAGNSTHPDDGKHFALFLDLFRATLDNSNLSHVKITACITGDPTKMDALPFEAMVRVLDSINIMTYDFMSSAWGSCITGHQTNIYSTEYSESSINQSVQACIERGVPREKIVIGAVLYSRGFANTDGLGTPAYGCVSDKSWEDGVVDYKDLPRPGAQEYYDVKAKAHFSYDVEKKILNSYDSVRSVKDKCRYVQEQGLQGIIVWESSGDFPPSDKRSLLVALHEGLFLNK